MAESLFERWRQRIKWVRDHATKMSVVVLADDPAMVQERPALKAIKYLERLVSDEELNTLSQALISTGISTRTVFGVRALVRAAVDETLFPADTPIKVVIDKTEGGGHRDGFGPARRSTVALLCNQFGFHYPHSDAYAAAITRHKHHQAMLLHQAGIPAPKTWSFHPERGWQTGAPPEGLKVLCKSTYEAWSVGVSENTVRSYDSDADQIVAALCKELGQPVCVQEFIDGPEIYAAVLDPGVAVCTGMIEVRARGGPKSNGSYLVFDDHFRPDGLVYLPVSTVSAAVRDRIAHLAVRTFMLMSMSFVGRVDFRVSEDGTPHVIDIADNPGTAPNSSLTRILTSGSVPLEDQPLLLLSMSLAPRSVGDTYRQ